jgi:small-conductance mechanosensitive channel
MRRRSIETIRLVAVLAALLILLATTVAAQGGPPSQPSPGEKGKAVSPPSLVDLIPWATGLSDRLTVLKKNTQTLVDLPATGEQWRKIKHIGLRATIVQTFDNSEIVVPNNDLVINQVTNWTLSDRMSRITIPVRVAPGSDVSLVMETIRACAEGNPLVMKNPAPDVSFIGFGESALDFRLLAWVADVDNRGQTQTEILREIDRRFRELKIEIPLPQRDVRIRSAADSDSRALSRPAPSSPDFAPRKESE